MMIQSKRNLFILIALVIVTVTVGEAWGIRAALAASPAKRITLRMMMPGEPKPSQLSPITGFGAVVGEPIFCNVIEPLVDYTKDGPVPRLATKWEQRGPTTWRFYLRKGVKFHNGTDFTARDVAELAKWNLEEKKVSELYQRVPIKEAVAVDDYTIDLIFETPQPLLLTRTRIFLIPPLAITRDNRKMAETNPMGTGPYRFVEWKKGQHIKLTKFEGYWGSKPQIDDVEISFREEEAVRVAALQVGEVDWVYGLSSESTGKAPKIVHIPSPETVWLRLDEYILKELGGVSILADKRLRLALDYAIDRKALVTLYGGFAIPSLGQFASPGDFGFNPGSKSRPYDLEKARALVREADAIGKTLTFVGAPDQFSKGRELAEAIAYMIEQTGLKVKLMMMPRTEVSKYKSVLGDNRKYMSDIVIGSSDALLEVETRYGQFFVQGGRDMALNDPEPTRLYKEEVLPEADYAKRGAKVAKAWEYVYEQAHYTPIFKPEFIWGVAKNLEWRVDIAGRPFIADMRFTE